MPRHNKKIIDIGSAIILLTLIMLDVMTWSVAINDMYHAHTGGASRAAQLYFLPVTQGESALLVLPNNVTIATDAGADASIVDDLQKVMPSDGTTYIDLAIISYEQSTDYDGYKYLLDHFHIGAFLYNGRSDATHPTDWQKLMDAIDAKHIPLVTIGAGDRIHVGAAGEIDILSPDSTFARSPEPSDTGIVQRIVTPNLTALLTADIGANVENALLERRYNVKANILKAPFPGLSDNTGNPFLNAIAAKTIIITPGTKNAASAPTKAMLAHLASSTSATIADTSHGAFLLYNK